jgi:hypothetical protein
MVSSARQTRNRKRNKIMSSNDTERPTIHIFANELHRGIHVADDSARGDGVVFRTETMDAYPINKVLVWFYGNSYAESYWADQSVEVFADVVWCDQCAGTGTVHDPKDCPTCYGQGWWNGA